MSSASLCLHICDTAKNYFSSCSYTLRSFDACDFHSERQEVRAGCNSLLTSSDGNIFCVVEFFHLISQFSTFRVKSLGMLATTHPQLFFHWLSVSQNNFVQSAAPQWSSSTDLWRAGLDLSASQSNQFSNKQKKKKIGCV